MKMVKNYLQISPPNVFSYSLTPMPQKLNQERFGSMPSLSLIWLYILNESFQKFSGMILLIFQGPPGDQQGQNQGNSGAPTSGAGPTPGGQGQPDYSAAWAMYYQQLYQQQAAAAAGQPAGGNTAQGVILSANDGKNSNNNSNNNNYNNSKNNNYKNSNNNNGSNNNNNNNNNNNSNQNKRPSVNQ